MQPVRLELQTGLKLVRMTRPKSTHISRLARSTMLSKIHHGHHLSGPLADQGPPTPNGAIVSSNLYGLFP